ncbi:unnamed protein product [Brassicogethes aeneus]|uniref:C2H2-type domain-containing protein n=1 Tax=Brassicogethes aeneus TaxID=1431903 RepID=A0A9P0B9M9_BRAAE|nr:unnamed protein product [Brassicogethes aeneus]
MVNSGSYKDRNEKAAITQPQANGIRDDPPSPVTTTAIAQCKADSKRTADAAVLPSAIEPKMSTAAAAADAAADAEVSSLALETTQVFEDDAADDRSVCCSSVSLLSTTTDNAAADAKMKPNPSRKLLCLYCDRTFVSANLRQKHVERCHSAKQTRRVSPRQMLTATPCVHCDKLNNTEHTLKDLFQHLTTEHSNKYYACSPCEERFLSPAQLTEHNASNHPNKTVVTPPETPTGRKEMPAVEESAEDTPQKVTRSRLKLSESSAEPKKPPSGGKKSDKSKDLRGKKLSVKTSKIALKRSKRLQAKDPIENTKLKRSRQPNNGKTVEGTSSNTKPNEKPGKSTFNCVNPYPEFDSFYRVKKITDHSIDNLKISSLTFDDVFDKAFFNRIKCNIQENLLHHIDGKLFKNEESESRISNFEKTPNVQQEVQNSNSESYGCELSINAVTPVAALSLNSQYGEDFESQIEYGSKPSKKKNQTKSKDEVHYKYFTRRKYQASILEHKENRDLSKLDMWTQLVIKNRQQRIVDDHKSAKEILEYTSGDEYKNKTRKEELNRILDRRGPFEDLKEEASKQAALDKLNSHSSQKISQETFSEVREVLNEILKRVHDICEEPLPKLEPEIIEQPQERELPSYLNLRRTCTLPVEGDIDKSDKIALICSSQETENFELPTNSVRELNEQVELTGEWARTRMYICAACGKKIPNMKQLLEHKTVYHQNVWVQHYEFVGKQNELYRHLSIPGLGKVGVVEDCVPCRVWKRSDARLCTKCGKQCNALGELHRHVLECGGDWTWMLARKKCKYRPFGARTRRKRRGLVKRTYRSNKTDRPAEKKPYKKSFEGPRQRPSDADTIQRMLANLPAKRSTRKIMSLQDGSRQRKNRDNKATATQNKVKCGKVIYKNCKGAETKNLSSPKTIKNVKRNFNTVLSSRLLDSNSTLRTKRILKNLVNKRVTRQTKEKVDEEVVEEEDQKPLENEEEDEQMSPKRKKSNKNKENQEENNETLEPIKRVSPRKEKSVSPQQPKKKMTVKKILTGKINIKSFFPVKKKKKVNNTDSNNAETTEITTRNKRRSREPKEETEIVTPSEEAPKTDNTKQGKKGIVNSLVRTLSMKKKKKAAIIKENVETASTTPQENPEETTKKTETNKDFSQKKRKLTRSFRKVIKRVKKQKTEIPQETVIQNEKGSEHQQLIANQSVAFLEKPFSTGNTMEKIVAPSILEKTENIVDNSTSVPTAISCLENILVPETMFNLETSNEKSLQAKGELNFDSKEIHIFTTDIIQDKQTVVTDDVQSKTVPTITVTEVPEKSVINDLEDKTGPITIETSSKCSNSPLSSPLSSLVSPSSTSMISPSMSKKVRKPARGLNDCIAMLTNKLHQKTDVKTKSEENLPSAATKTENEKLKIAEKPIVPKLFDKPAVQKPECILKIPTFKSAIAEPAIEQALDLTKKSSESLDLSKKSTECLSPNKNRSSENITKPSENLMQPIHFEPLMTRPAFSIPNLLGLHPAFLFPHDPIQVQRFASLSNLDRIIESVVENKAPIRVSSSIDNIIQQVVDNSYSINKSTRNVSPSKEDKFQKNSVDNVIDFVIKTYAHTEDAEPNTVEVKLKDGRKIGSLREQPIKNNQEEEVATPADEDFNTAFVEEKEVEQPVIIEPEKRKIGQPRKRGGKKIKSKSQAPKESKPEQPFLETNVDELLNTKEVASKTEVSSSSTIVKSAVIESSEEKDINELVNEDEPHLLESKLVPKFIPQPRPSDSEDDDVPLAVLAKPDLKQISKDKIKEPEAPKDNITETPLTEKTVDVVNILVKKTINRRGRKPKSKPVLVQEKPDDIVMNSEKETIVFPELFPIVFTPPQDINKSEANKTQSLLVEVEDSSLEENTKTPEKSDDQQNDNAIEIITDQLKEINEDTDINKAEEINKDIDINTSTKIIKDTDNALEINEDSKTNTYTETKIAIDTAEITVKEIKIKEAPKKKGRRKKGKRGPKKGKQQKLISIENIHKSSNMDNSNNLTQESDLSQYVIDNEEPNLIAEKSANTNENNKTTELAVNTAILEEIKDETVEILKETSTKPMEKIPAKKTEGHIKIQIKRQGKSKTRLSSIILSDKIDHVSNEESNLETYKSNEVKETNIGISEEPIQVENKDTVIEISETPKTKRKGRKKNGVPNTNLDTPEVDTDNSLNAEPAEIFAEESFKRSTRNLKKLTRTPSETKIIENIELSTPKEEEPKKLPYTPKLITKITRKKSSGNLEEYFADSTVKEISDINESLDETKNQSSFEIEEHKLYIVEENKTNTDNVKPIPNIFDFDFKDEKFKATSQVEVLKTPELKRKGRPKTKSLPIEDNIEIRKPSEPEPEKFDINTEDPKKLVKKPGRKRRSVKSRSPAKSLVKVDKQAIDNLLAENIEIPTACVETEPKQLTSKVDKQAVDDLLAENIEIPTACVETEPKPLTSKELSNETPASEKQKVDEPGNIALSVLNLKAGRKRRGPKSKSSLKIVNETDSNHTESNDYETEESPLILEKIATEKPISNEILNNEVLSKDEAKYMAKEVKNQEANSKLNKNIPTEIEKIENLDIFEFHPDLETAIGNDVIPISKTNVNKKRRKNKSPVKPILDEYKTEISSDTKQRGSESLKKVANTTLEEDINDTLNTELSNEIDTSESRKQTKNQRGRKPKKSIENVLDTENPGALIVDEKDKKSIEANLELIPKIFVKKSKTIRESSPSKTLSSADDENNYFVGSSENKDMITVLKDSNESLFNLEKPDAENQDILKSSIIKQTVVEDDIFTEEVEDSFSAAGLELEANLSLECNNIIKPSQFKDNLSISSIKTSQEPLENIPVVQKKRGRKPAKSTPSKIGMRCDAENQDILKSSIIKQTVVEDDKNDDIFTEEVEDSFSAAGLELEANLSLECNNIIKPSQFKDNLSISSIKTSQEPLENIPLVQKKRGRKPAKSTPSKIAEQPLTNEESTPNITGTSAENENMNESINEDMLVKKSVLEASKSVTKIKVRRKKSELDKLTAAAAILPDLNFTASDIDISRKSRASKTKAAEKISKVTVAENVRYTEDVDLEKNLEKILGEIDNAKEKDEDLPLEKLDDSAVFEEINNKTSKAKGRKRLKQSILEETPNNEKSEKLNLKRFKPESEILEDLASIMSSPIDNITEGNEQEEIKKKPKRKSKISKKIDNKNMENHLFQDFTLVINSKSRSDFIFNRFGDDLIEENKDVKNDPEPLSSEIEEKKEPPTPNIDANTEPPRAEIEDDDDDDDSLGNDNDAFDESFDMVDMELDEIPTENTIIEREIPLNTKKASTDELFDKLLYENKNCSTSKVESEEEIKARIVAEAIQRSNRSLNLDDNEVENIETEFKPADVSSNELELEHAKSDKPKFDFNKYYLEKISKETPAMETGDVNEPISFPKTIDEQNIEHKERNEKRIKDTNIKAKKQSPSKIGDVNEPISSPKAIELQNIEHEESNEKPIKDTNMKEKKQLPSQIKITKIKPSDVYEFDEEFDELLINPLKKSLDVFNSTKITEDKVVFSKNGLNKTTLNESDKSLFHESELSIDESDGLINIEGSKKKTKISKSSLLDTRTPEIKSLKRNPKQGKVANIDLLDEHLLFDKSTEENIENTEIRRSRRSKKVTSYNENELDPLLDIEDKVKLRKKNNSPDNGLIDITENINLELSQKPAPSTPDKKINTDELFDMLKETTTVECNNKVESPFIENLDDTSEDFNDDKFDNAFENILEKSMAVLQNQEDHKKSDIYEFTESPDALDKEDLKEKRTRNNSTSKANIDDINMNSSDIIENDSISDKSSKANKKNFKAKDTSGKPNYCEICKKSFIRVENLVKHKRTLTHISKLSEIEAKEAEERAKTQQQEEHFQLSELIEDSIILDESSKNDALVSSFSANPPNNLKLADLINDVINEPAIEHTSDKQFQNASANEMQPEIRRYKSLGERKSFESENSLINTDTQSIKSPFYEPALSKTTILEKQISLLQNIIENQSGMSYIDDISMSSNNSVIENTSVRAFPEIIKDDSSNITFTNAASLTTNIKPTTNDERFLKPATQFEEISEDSTNIRNYEEQKLRKTLNRDEELFLECCSLLKSGSEVSNYSNSKSNKLPNIPNKIDMQQADEPNWLENKSLSNKNQSYNVEYSDNSRIPTPLGDNYADDASNSNTINSNWNVSVGGKDIFEDISQDKDESFTFEEVLNNTDSETKSGLSRFGGMLSKTIKNQINNLTNRIRKTAEKRGSSSERKTIDELSDCSTSDSKKIMTKGAMKVFEGLKVSIPTEELNLEEVLNCSPRIKKSEILKDEDKKSAKSEELLSPSKRNARKSKPVKNKSQFGSKLLFKMNKKKHKNDVYDFEDTQDNLNVFTKPDKNKKDEDSAVKDSDSESKDNELFETNSVSSVSSPSNSVQQNKKPKSQQNLTKKKCMIMGRIFKNAVKSKVEEEIRDIPAIDNVELVENYVKEIKKISDNEFNLTEEKNQDEDNVKSKHIESRRKSVKQKNRKRARANSESTDDEFSINKTTKKRTYKKNPKPEDNCINLEQELKECIGVASRKSQRKCTSGKQNVLMEYWSSDDSAFEALLESQIIESKPDKEPKKPKETPIEKPPVEEVVKEVVDKVNTMPAPKLVEKKIQKKVKPHNQKSKSHKSEAQAATSNRRKRAAVNPLYHWSSSSEDESSDLITVKPVRDEADDEDERPIQHGWIVGDSPKKLVTLLAHAKGKKTDIDSVKEQKKRTNSVS